jgi:hypothetical protein
LAVFETGGPPGIVQLAAMPLFLLAIRKTRPSRRQVSRPMPQWLGWRDTIQFEEDCQMSTISDRGHDAGTKVRRDAIREEPES